MRKFSFLVIMVFLIGLLEGCAYANFSVMDVRNREEGSTGRTCTYWSGVQTGDRITVKEGEEVRFQVDMEKGSVTFILKDSEGNEVYSVTKEGEYSGTETYTAEKDEKLWLTEKGSGFKGNYKITWGKQEGMDGEEGGEDNNI